MRVDSLPIGIRAFNRPDCLERLLRSLQTQFRQSDSNDLTIVCDSYRESTDEATGKKNRTGELHDLICSYFPQARILTPPRNLGPARALSLLQAEVFGSKSDADWSHFLEEDIVLDADYISTSEALIERLVPFEDVAKVSLLQPHKAYADLPNLLPTRSLVIGQGTQAFAESRLSYTKRLPLMKTYIDLLGSGNYKNRDEKNIISGLAKLGLITSVTNNDAVIDRLLQHLGLIHVCFNTNLVTDSSRDGETGAWHPRFLTPIFDSSRLLQLTPEQIDGEIEALRDDLSLIADRELLLVAQKILVGNSARRALKFVLSQISVRIHQIRHKQISWRRGFRI